MSSIVSNYNCVKCGRYASYEDSYLDAFDSKLKHRGKCPPPPQQEAIEERTEYIKIVHRLRPFCRPKYAVEYMKHVQCTAVGTLTELDGMPTIVVCSCHCHES